ncbi:hypothetical protein B0H63DRAFT_515948 [Podospora didyma]|uniref:Rhodopsin domain-containing protein n=1 Tax=Podospora didyma TaxID=330526 RepID=A0AAE0P3H2_9PEZI|nr:hypothetical protein B0H63DRAFT_515948 [Podospora didyma]
MSETSPSPSSLPPPPPPPLLPFDLPHDSHQNNIYASSVICWAIAAVFVALRFYTRGVIIRVLGPTDWCILTALVFAAATSAGVIEQAVHGSGRHVWDLDPTDTASAIAWGRAAWYGILFYLLSLCFSKISILLLYIHLFSFQWARRGGQVLLAIVIVSNVYMAVTTFTACIPLQSYWDFTIPKQYCHPQSIWWSNTGLHMATDFLIFLLPMPVVWSIMLPRRQKLILSGVFGLGFIVCFISILRLLQLIQVENYPNPDFTWSAAELSYLTAVEINGAIVCACVMTLKPFVSRFFPSVLGRGGSSSSGSRSSPHRRPSDNTMAGPPTIGSRPSKGPMSPLSPVDSDMVSKRRGSALWMDSGYVEIDDTWVVDVELAENAPSGASNSKTASSSTESGSGQDIGTGNKEKTDSNDDDATNTRGAAQEAHDGKATVAPVPVQVKVETDVVKEE